MKQYHFVYKTTCHITNSYYYGVHSTNSINDSYIGSGIKFLNYVKKYGTQNFTREIIKFCDTREQAFLYEKEILTETLLNDPQCLNLTMGGRGYAHPYGETFKDRISKTRKQHLREGKIIPAKHTEQHKQKLRENNPGGKATAKPIHQIDTSGNVIKTWSSSRQAGMVLKLKSWRNISALANKKTPQTAYGFYWRWAEDSDVVDNKLITIDELEKIRTDKGMRSGKSVQQICPSTNEVIKVWKNMCEAAKCLNIDNSSISLAIKKQRQYNGFYWKLTKQKSE